MYPIIQSKLIQPSDFYTHFLLAAVPLDVTGDTYFTLVSNGTVKSKTLTLPTPITVNGTDTWKIDIWLYGLNAIYSTTTIPSTAMSIHTDVVLQIRMGDNTQNVYFGSSFSPTFTTSSSSPGKKTIPHTMRHQQAFFGGTYKEEICELFITGQFGELTTSPEIYQGTGTDWVGSTSTSQTYSTVTISGVANSDFPNVTISGLYIEFTRISPTNPTNGYKSVIL